MDDLSEKVKGIIIYRKKEIAEKVGKKAISMGIPLIWLPLGITSDLIKQQSKANGLLFVEDKCPKVELRRIEK